MAIIGTIRDKGRYVLIGFVGLALVTFILTGFFDSFGGGPVQGNLGTIDGEEVNVDNYNKYVNQFMLSDQQSFQQQQREYTDRDKEQSEDRAFQLAVDEQLLFLSKSLLLIYMEKMDLHCCQTFNKILLILQQGNSTLNNCKNSLKSVRKQQNLKRLNSGKTQKKD
jgi:hypothetical protein